MQKRGRGPGSDILRGKRGILITTDAIKEIEAIREAKELLSEYADILYPRAAATAEDDASAVTEEGGDAPAAGAGDAAGVKTEGKGDDAEDGGGGATGRTTGTVAVRRCRATCRRSWRA